MNETRTLSLSTAPISHNRTTATLNLLHMYITKTNTSHKRCQFGHDSSIRARRQLEALYNTTGVPIFKTSTKQFRWHNAKHDHKCPKLKSKHSGRYTMIMKPIILQIAMKFFAVDMHRTCGFCYNRYMIIHQSKIENVLDKFSMLKSTQTSKNNCY